jgi:hypothetical protein
VPVAVATRFVAIFDEGVTEIPDGCFQGCDELTNVTLPSTLLRIGQLAFVECHNLTEIVFPGRTTLIGQQAFAGCSSLASVKFPSTMNSIGAYAFAGCSKLTAACGLPSTATIGSTAFGSPDVEAYRTPVTEAEAQQSCFASSDGSCPAGVGFRTDTGCAACEIGYYSDVSDLSPCIACPIGYFGSAEGSVSCTQCARGKYNDAATNGCDKSCSNTESPFYQISLVCQECTAGRFYSSATYACVDCPASYYQPSISTSCDLCPVGQYQMETGKGYCNECKAGQYSYSNSTYSSCIKCPISYYQPTISTACDLCPAGQYQMETGKGHCNEVPYGSTIVMKSTTETPGELVQVMVGCPRAGVECSYGRLSYAGGVWHDPNVQTPNCTDTEPAVCTRFYACVNNGKL